VKRSFTDRWVVGSAVLAAVLYAAMWIGWTHGWSWLAAVDGAALDASHRIGAEYRGWATFWDVLCSVFSPVTFRVLAVGMIVYEVTRRRGWVALFLLVSVELSAVLTEVAKRLADRPRPETAMVDAASSSFPSGHALGTMVAVLALAVVLLPRIPRSRRAWAITAGVLVIVLVGIGRVALNVHHPSDVVAGWALGYLYFLACLPLLRRQSVTASDETPEALGSAR
jgi:membrane-associated phospholipid phosphatase